MPKRQCVEMNYSRGVGGVISGGRAQVHAASWMAGRGDNGGVKRGREMQKARLAEASPKHQPGRLAYLVNRTWWQHLQGYLSGARDVGPGEIRNVGLLDPAVVKGEHVALSGGPALRK
jgi:hypothetical protein